MQFVHKQVDTKSRKICSVFQCSSYCTKEISLHAFPTDPKLCKTWQTILEIGKPLTKYMYVCSQHFVKGDFIQATSRKRRLKKQAIPSQKIPKTIFSSKEVQTGRLNQHWLPTFKNDIYLVIEPKPADNSNNTSIFAEHINYGPSDVLNSDDSCTESGVEAVEEMEDIKIEIVDNDILNGDLSSLGRNVQDEQTIEDDNEANTRTNSFSMESQVQVTCLAGNDTATEGLLKRKLKQLAENDIIKSKKIKELNNIILIKNKAISELMNEIAKLKEDRKKKLMQM